jgi:hypothetical protein
LRFGVFSRCCIVLQECTVSSLQLVKSDSIVEHGHGNVSAFDDFGPITIFAIWISVRTVFFYDLTSRALPKSRRPKTSSWSVRYSCVKRCFQNGNVKYLGSIIEAICQRKMRKSGNSCILRFSDWSKVVSVVL